MRKPESVRFSLYSNGNITPEGFDDVLFTKRHHRVVITFRKKDGIFWKSPDVYGRSFGDVNLPFSIHNLEAMTKMDMAEVIEHVFQRYNVWRWTLWEKLFFEG